MFLRREGSSGHSVRRLSGLLFKRDVSTTSSSVLAAPVSSVLNRRVRFSSSPQRRLREVPPRPTPVVFPIEPRKKPRDDPGQSGVSMRTPFPGTPALEPIATSKPATFMTTLDNGMVIATEENYDQSSTVGVFVSAGSANEQVETNGVTHLLQRMGFKATKTRSNAQIVRQLETLGVNAVSSSSRECVVFSTDCMRAYTQQVVEILADVMQHPLYLDEDVEQEKKVISNELADLHLDPGTWLTEVLHEVAFGPQGYGLSQICPPDNLEKLDRNLLADFHDTYFTTPNIVVAAVGVEHEPFVELISKQFKDLPTVRSPKEFRPSSVYQGGYHIEIMAPDTEKRMKEILPKTGKEAPSHIVVAFDTPGFGTEDLYPACVLQTLMGGGSSFSSGGPGKGMYSRLYREVLNQYGWVDSISCFNSFYKNGGLFGFYGTAPHGCIGDMLQIIGEESAGMVVGFSEEEVERAKNQLRSAIFMHLESRMVLYDDIGRQILAYGHRKSADEICDKIANVNEEDLVRVAGDILRSKPTVVAYTPEEYAGLVPEYAKIAEWYPQVLTMAQEQRAKLATAREH